MRFGGPAVGRPRPTGPRVLPCLAGAAIDVFESEPDVTQSPLVGAPRALLSPHMAGLTSDAIGLLGSWCERTTLAFLSSGKVEDADLVPPGNAKFEGPSRAAPR